VVLVTACGGAQRRPLPEPVIPAIHDQTIVPGSRVGPISLGMTEAQLLDAVGAPTTSFVGDDGKQHRYETLGLNAYVHGGRVDMVGVFGTSYATTDGIRVGSSELEVTARLGEPSWKRDNDVTDSYCYADGTSIAIGGTQNYDCEAGKVCGIIVNGCNP
jgi:hypothetical protein